MTSIAPPALPFPVGAFEQSLERDYTSKISGSTAADGKLAANFNQAAAQSIKGEVSCPNWAGVRYVVLPWADSPNLREKVLVHWQNELLEYARHVLTGSSLIARSKQLDGAECHPSALLVYANGRKKGPPNVLLAVICRDPDKHSVDHFVGGVSIAATRSSGDRVKLVENHASCELRLFTRASLRPLDILISRFQQLMDAPFGTKAYPGWINLLSIACLVGAVLSLGLFIFGYHLAAATIAALVFADGLYLDWFFSKVKLTP